MVFNSKQKRAFQTVLSGLKFAKFGNKSIRFLTLTTSVIQYDNIDRIGLNEAFSILRKRITRSSPYSLYKQGYVTKHKMHSLYPRKDLMKKFSFEYFKVQTNEGNGVLHILFRGDYLPYNFLVDNWMDINNSWDLNIKQIDLADLKSASCYVVSQYVSNQRSSYVRSSQSWNWVFYGFKSKWYMFRHWYPDTCFELWDDYLKNISESSFFPQLSLSSFG